MSIRATRTGITKLAKLIPSSKPSQKVEKRLLNNESSYEMGNSATQTGRTELAKLIPSSKPSQKTNKIPPPVDIKSYYEKGNLSTKCRFVGEDKCRNTINWSPMDSKSSYEIRKCLANGWNAKIRLAPESMKKDLPRLCALLGLKYRANADDVLSILKSSSAFSAKAIAAAGFVPSDLKGGTTSGTKEVLEVEEEPKTGSVRVKIRIPMKYEDELADGKSAPRREKFELFVKNGLADAFKVPISLLSPEVDIAEIQNGSVLVTLILSASALTLVYVGKELPQTPTWQYKKFDILTAMGGAAVGSIFALAAGGPGEAGTGAVIGTTAGFAIAWYLNRDVQDGAARAKALLVFKERVIAISIKFFK